MSSDEMVTTDIMNRDISWDEFDAEFSKRRMLAVMEPLCILTDPAIRLEQRAVDRADKPYLLFKDQCYTFAEMNARTNQVARALHTMDVRYGEGVAIFMKNKPEYMFSFYACLKLYVTASLLNTNIRTKSLIHCVKEGACKYIIVDDDPDMVSAVCEIRDDLRAAGVRVLVFGKRQQGFNSLSDVADDQSKSNIGIYREDAAQLIGCHIFTSGTTGLPKAVKQPRARIGFTSVYYTVANLRPDDILYAPLPLYHISALFCFANMALYAGLTFSFAEKFSSQRFWADCIKYNATVIQYIGETCRYLVASAPSKLDKAHNVRLAYGNGLRRDIWPEFKSRFNIRELMEFYGATDGNTALFNLTGKLGACGRRAPSKNLQEGEPKLHIIRYDTENDVVYRGTDGLCRPVEEGRPGLMVTEVTETTTFPGYSNKQQTEKKHIADVIVKGDFYLNTGDLMMRDRESYIYFVDRLGDTFRWKGENVSTQEVANLLCDLDLITDCCVYGVKTASKDGRCGMAAVVLKPGLTHNKDALEKIYQHCDQFLPAYARPVFIRFMPELHLTGTYKHQRFNLQKEGYDITVVSDVYYLDRKARTYSPLTPSIHKSILNGAMKANL